MCMQAVLAACTLPSPTPTVQYEVDVAIEGQAWYPARLIASLVNNLCSLAVDAEASRAQETQLLPSKHRLLKLLVRMTCNSCTAIAAAC